MNIQIKLQSFVINCLYWLCHPFKYPVARHQKETCTFWLTKVEPTYLNIERFMKTFTYEETDRWCDYRPWIITYFARNMRGDCSASAVAGKWSLACIGVKSAIYSLRDSMSKSVGHAVCVSEEDESGKRILIDGSAGDAVVIKIITKDVKATLLRKYSDYDNVKISG